MEESRIYNILVYGIERKMLDTTTKEIRSRNYKLTFEPFDSKLRFNDFDGVILFQGIFENKIIIEEWDNSSYIKLTFDRDELDKRDKEFELLLKNGGFCCVILCEPFVDKGKYDNYLSTDLSKRYLNYRDFYRRNFERRTTEIISKLGEFQKFIEIYGAANSYFNNHNVNIQWKVIAEKHYGSVVGMIINNIFFIPSLIPKEHEIQEYFNLLSEALTSVFIKLQYELPDWLNGFEFEEEKQLKDSQIKIFKELKRIDGLLVRYEEFKRILVLDSDLLVEAVSQVLREGFEFKIDEKDEYREDRKILTPEGGPIVFCEIKGTNRGVKREHINQADSHRERAGLPPDFPSILIINTNIKNSRNLEEKDQPVPTEQIKHAYLHKVLILRAIDLLRLLRLFMLKKITKEEILEVFIKRSGWLKVSDDRWEIITEEGSTPPA